MTNDGTRATRLLLATRFVRSIGQGALVVDFALYLRALDWPGGGNQCLLGRSNDRAVRQEPVSRSKLVGRV
jgi:hypothetical protein